MIMFVEGTKLQPLAVKTADVQVTSPVLIINVLMPRIMNVLKTQTATIIILVQQIFVQGFQENALMKR